MSPEALALEKSISLTLAEPLADVVNHIVVYDGQRTWAGGVIIRTEVDQTAADSIPFNVRMGGETGSTGWIIGTLQAGEGHSTKVEARYGIEPHLTASMVLVGALPVVALIGAGLHAFLIGLLVAVMLFIGMFIAVALLQSRVERHLHILFNNDRLTEDTPNGTT